MPVTLISHHKNLHAKKSWGIMHTLCKLGILASIDALLSQTYNQIYILH